MPNSIAAGRDEPALRPRRGVRVVVADDERDAVMTLAQILIDEGYEVREVYRGDAVLGAVREFDPHAVLLDIGMPGMTGYEVARELRALYGGERPLLIAVTGWTKGADEVLGKIVGFQHYVRKPYETATILELLETITPPRTA